MRSISDTGWLLASSLALLSAGCSCGPRTITSETSESDSIGSTSPGVPDVPPDLPPDLPPTCGAPLLLCDGECVDPQFDSDHCGQCGHKCNVPPPEYYQVGRCWGAECRPTYYECIRAEDGFESCESYYSSIGQECPPEGSDCGNGILMWGSEQGAACEAFEGGTAVGGAIGCTSSIPFGEFEIPDGGGIATFARCCCTQD